MEIICGDAKMMLEELFLFGETKRKDLINNERINSGKYKIDFDGSRLSSGIYYYSIFSNNFYDTKKMTILK